MAMHTTKVQISNTSGQADQRLCPWLLRYYDKASFFIQNFRPQTSLCRCAGYLKSGNPIKGLSLGFYDIGSIVVFMFEYL